MKTLANFTSDSLDLKAEKVNSMIFTISNQTLNAFQKDVAPLHKLEANKVGRMSFVLSYVFLFNAVLFLRKSLPFNQHSYFENKLFDLFKKQTKVDPKIHMNELASYSKNGNPSNLVAYVGEKVGQEIKYDEDTVKDIKSIFASYLDFGFPDSIRKAWDMRS